LDDVCENVPVIFNNENAKVHYLSEISKKKGSYFKYNKKEEVLLNVIC
jgi:hypothetical protein